MASEQSGPGRDQITAALAAQQERAPRPKRFFSAASVAERGQGFAVLLDGRPARTPARRDLALPTWAAATLVAEEWDRLGETVDPAEMPLTRIVNSTIDGVADQSAAVFDDIMGYAGSDLLFYRAGEPERLVAAQAAAWDPVLDLFVDGRGARFVLAEGVMHVVQPPATLSILRQSLAEAVGADSSAPFRLACANVMTTLTGSALLALAVMQHELRPEQAWELAHVDERFQESLWGEDAEALARRQARWREMQAAALLAAAL